MKAPDFFTMSSAKSLEYLIAVTFLIVFVPFWRFVNGKPVAAPAFVAETPRRLAQMVDWFHVPGDVYFHPGHAWVRVDDGNLATVGMDDFAHKLVGVSAISLPQVGMRLGQGEKGWSLTRDAKSVDMLSPVDGTVVAVNERALSSPQAIGRDPYGDGGLLKVKASRPVANMKHLLSGSLAKRWMEEVCAGLRARTDADLGLVYQDGGLPVEGMAPSLDPAHWDAVAKEFFLT